jgi:general L-amino acid transport system substrate-binding protein
MTRARAIASWCLLAAAATAGCAGAGTAGTGPAATLDAVRARGFLRCGVSTGVAGFSTIDGRGEWHGVDVDLCRAIAAAVLGDAAKVRYTPLTATRRFAALQTGDIDLLSRNTTLTFQRDAQLGFEFPAVNWYDGTTFIVRRSRGIDQPRQLGGATICVTPGTTTEADVADYFRKHDLRFTPVVIERLEEAQTAYFNGRCDAFASDQSALAGVRSRAARPDDHLVMAEMISKAPLGPAVMPSDTRWVKVVRWVVFAMIDAEELGLTAATIDAALANPAPEIRRFVGNEGDFGPMLGLDRRWAFAIVKQVGNMHESFERNLKPLGIERGPNRLWKDGGLFYVPDIR